jgi:hypothetical protein
MDTALASLKEECPLCGSELSRVKFAEIQTRQRADDERRVRLAKIEAEKVVALERKKLADQWQKLDAKAKADKEALKQRSEEHREALGAARALVEKTKAEKDAIEAKMKEQVQSAVAAARKQFEAKAAERAGADREKDRLTIKADYDKKMIQQSGAWQTERLKLLSKMKEMERKLEAKTANELGDGAEINLYDTLRAEWDEEGDKIRQIRKGEEGADILHEIKYKGELCGRILIESKNRLKWLNDDTAKLHEDTLAAGADHGILAAIKFPAAKSEMFVQDGVLVMKPVEVAEIVRILRASLIRMHSLKLSNTERAEKTAKLYEYINSPEHKQNLAEIRKLAQDGLDQEVLERKQHDKWWQERAVSSKKTQRIVSAMETEIAAIIDGTANG